MLPPEGWQHYGLHLLRRQPQPSEHSLARHWWQDQCRPAIGQRLLLRISIGRRPTAGRSSLVIQFPNSNQRWRWHTCSALTVILQRDDKYRGRVGGAGWLRLFWLSTIIPCINPSVIQKNKTKILKQDCFNNINKINNNKRSADELLCRGTSMKTS